MNSIDNGNSLHGPSPFSNWACSHPFFDAVLRWLLQRVYGLSEPSLLLVIGPTGVGKSTLISQLEARLLDRLRGDMQADPSRLHKVYAEAQFLPGRGFDWDGLFLSLLNDAGEILSDRKVAPGWPPGRPGRRGLAAATNMMLRQRAPLACIIDEGGSFVESDSTESLARVLDFLKSISNQTKTHIVIFGDYRLARMVEVSGQLNRRSHVIHFPNYPVGHEAVFYQIIGAFNRRLKTRSVESLIETEREVLFRNTYGCVGLLKRWLESAWLSVAESKKPIDRMVLEAARFPTGSLNRWQAEIENGHQKMSLFFDGVHSPK